MFIGHFAPAMLVAAHKKAPSLPLLFVAGQLLDLAFFPFFLIGIESMRFAPGISVMNPMDLYHMPYTHSLVGAVGWALAFGVLLWATTKNSSGAMLACAVVLSHWFLDLLVHIPDLTLAGSPPKLGLGLWNYPAIEIPLELGLTFGALWFYARIRRSEIKSVLTLAGIMLFLQLFSWFGGADSGSITSLAVMGLLAFGLIIAAAWWAERGVAKG